MSNVFASGVKVEPQVLASATELSSTQRLFLDKINTIRSEAGVSELSYSRDIEELANYRTSDMSSREYYSHKTPEGYTYAKYFNDYSVEPGLSCENLQLQIGSDINAAIEAWNNSTSHYDCIVDARLSSVAFSYVPYMAQPNETENSTTFVFAMIATD